MLWAGRWEWSEPPMITLVYYLMGYQCLSHSLSLEVTLPILQLTETPSGSKLVN